MKNNIELVEFAKKALQEKWGYCLGSFGNILTPSFLRQKLAQGGGVGAYNTRHKAYLNTYINKRVSDCYGLVKGFLWWDNGEVKYIASQDRNQEMAYSAAKEKGTIATIPEVPGLILWMKGHAGIYIGNGEFIECKGAPAGMVKGRIVNGKVTSGSRFTHWFKDTYVDYKEKEELANKIKVNIKGRTVDLDGVVKYDSNKNTTNYVSIRQLAEALGYKVDWDNSNKVVIIK